ncbi:hypothetical protein D9M73_238970 [compost metagenome]
MRIDGARRFAQAQRQVGPVVGNDLAVFGRCHVLRKVHLDLAFLGLGEQGHGLAGGDYLAGLAGHVDQHARGWRLQAAVAEGIARLLQARRGGVAAGLGFAPGEFGTLQRLGADEVLRFQLAMTGQVGLGGGERRAGGGQVRCGRAD